METPSKKLNPSDKFFIVEGERILSEEKKYLSRIKFYGVFFTLLIATGVGVMYYMTTDLNNIEPATNRAAGEFAVEPGFTSSGVIIDPRCDTGIQNTCVFSVNNIQDAIDYCNKFPSICNRFIYNQGEGSVSFVSLNSGLSKSDDGSASVFTRQQGITQASESGTGQTFSSGTPISTPGALTSGSQVTTTGSGSTSVSYSVS